MDHEQRRKHIASLILQLEEFADDIQVSVSYVDEEKQTRTLHIGSGNWNCRLQMCREFILRHKARTEAYYLSEVLDEGWEDDDEEDDDMEEIFEPTDM